MYQLLSNLIRDAFQNKFDFLLKINFELAHSLENLIKMNIKKEKTE